VSINAAAPELFDDPIQTIVFLVQVGIVNLMNITQTDAFDPLTHP
jgi:hypothetical protein